MRLHLILVFGIILGVAACGEREQAPAEPMDAATEDAVIVDDIWKNQAFIDHMHLHAERLDELNFALADGDLDSAKASANWLSTHDTNDDIQADWMPHLYRMREEAQAVEAAPDIETAQAAALQITVQCQICHAAVGINAQ